MTKIKQLFLAFQFLAALTCYSQQSDLVYPGTNGKLVYANYANNFETNENNILPDFSNVGYMDGAVGVPVGEVPVKITLDPTPSGEDRTRIQAAIDQVCNMPLDANGFRGAVLLKKGTYRLNDGTIPVLSDGMGDALRIWASGVVLRGEGQGADGTILYSDFAKNHTMIILEPVSQSTSETNLTRITDAYVGTGAKTFTVADASSYAVGDNIMVRFTPNATWFSDLKVDVNGYITDPTDYWTTGNYNIGFKRKIIAKNGNTITIDCSVVQPMKTGYGGGEIKKYTTTGRLNKCGVEELRIVGIEDGGSPGVSGNGNRLRVGIRPRFVDNCWIHGVTVTRTSEAAVMSWGVMNVTVQECAYIDPRGPIDGGWRYSFCLDAGSTRVLFQRCYSAYGRHDFVTHARIPGPNVFVDCYSANGLSALGPHHRWATGTLFDNIKSTNSTMAINLFDLSNGHGFCGAQTVGWNLECARYTNDASRGSQNFLIGSIGAEKVHSVSPALKPGFVFRGYWEKSGPAGVHVNTRSLYFKQLEDRLGSAAVSNITIADQRTGNIYTKLASWAGNGKLLSPTVPVTSAGNGSEFIAQQNVPALLGLSQNTTVNVTMKNIGSTTWTKASGYKLGSQNTQDNMVWGFNRVELSDTDAILPGQEKTFQFAITAPSTVGNNNFQWKLLQGGVEWFGDVTPNRTIAIGAENYLDNCDSKTNWSLCNCTSVLNSVDKKQGLSSLEFTGPEIVEFSRVFSPAYNTVGSTTGATLQFWYYVSDVTKLTTKNQVEIGSSGVPDTNEYNWTLTGLVNGWNLVLLNTSTATKIGNPNLGAINWFRIHGLKTGSVTTRIDGIVLLGN